jgi:hypothetical protein
MSKKPLTKLTPEQLEMANDNIKLLYSFVKRNRTKYPRLEYGDIMGICAEGYCRAIQRYDPTKGTLGTFVYHYMRGYLSMHLTRHVDPNNNLYLEDLGVDKGGWEIFFGSEPDKHTDQFEVEEALKFIDSFKRYGLKQVEIDTLKWFYLLQDQPAPTQIIGDKYGITYQAISYRLKVMREKLEPYKEDIRIAVSG